MKKRRLIILSLFLILGTVLIVISAYLSRQTLKEVTGYEQKSPAQSISSGISAPKVAVFGQLKELPQEPQELKAEPPELEVDLQDIPEDYAKDIETKEAKKDSPSAERKLDTQPSLRELKELKTRRAVIY